MADVGIKFSADGYTEFRKNLDECQQNLKVLGSGLKEVKSQFDKNDNSVAALTKKNEALDRSIKAQKEQVSLLAKGVEQATASWGENDEKTRKLVIQYNSAKTALNKMTLEYDANAKAIDSAGDELKQTGEQLDKASESGLSFGDVLKANVIGNAIVSGVKALGSAIRDVASGMKDAVVDAAAFADDIMTTSTVTGLSTDALQEYQYMAELTDTSVDTITGSLTKLTKNMETAKGGTGAAAEAFSALGVSFTDSNGELKNNQEVFGNVIDALAKMENGTQRDAYSMAIFGKSAQDLNPLMAQGKDGIAALAQEAHDMGYVLDNDALSSLGAVDDAMQRFNNTKTTIKNEIASQLAPVIEDIAAKFQSWALSVDWGAIGEKIQGAIDTVKDLFGFIKENWETIVSAIAAIAAGFIAWNVVGMITGLVAAITNLGGVLPAVKIGIEAVNAAMKANVIGIIVTAVAALVTGLIVLWNTNEDFRNAVIKIWENIKEAFAKAIDSIANAFDKFKQVGSNIVKGIKDGIANAWKGLKDWFNGLWDGLFGKKTVSVNAKTTVNGSHASGLDYVPFDGYIAQLHKGEMVVPAALASSLRSVANINGSKSAPVSVSDLRGVVSTAVNAMSAAGGSGSGDLYIEIPVDGQKFYRATIKDFRRVSKATPEVFA